VGTSNNKFGVWKINTTGAFDSTFGTAGKVETLVNVNLCYANNLALQPDGKILVVGGTDGVPFTKYGLVRYTNDATLTANTFSGSDHIFVYPNPSNGNFNIEIDEALIGAKATIYNLLGQKIKEFDIKTTTTNQFLNKGVYLLEIEKDGIKTSKKLIIN
jgi:sugar lactone lactonase YvrE